MPLLALPYPSWLSPEIIPGLPFRWYGLMYLFAFGTAYLLFNYQVKEKDLKLPQDDITNFFFWTILGLLIGARILAALVYDTSGKYLANPFLIFWPFDNKFRFTGLQGMSYHGGLLGAVTAVVLYCRIKKYSTLEWGDMLVAGIPLGYTFGRLGNFINGELYGRVTSAPWGMYFAQARKFSANEPWVREIAARVGIPLNNPNALVNLPRHPSQLYEAFFEGIFLWAVLWFLVRNRRHFKGFIIGVYMIGYGTIRFFIEYFREPDQGIEFPIRLSSLENPPHLLVTPWNFTTGQILCLLMILGGTAALIIFHRLNKAGRAGPKESGTAQTSKGRSLRRIRKKLR
jgi:phosphatidylglycerol:prolipoprotein diacylglycerol transferase